MVVTIASAITESPSKTILVGELQISKNLNNLLMLDYRLPWIDLSDPDSVSKFFVPLESHFPSAVFILTISTSTDSKMP